MLTYAFDLLYAIYEEQGYAPSEIPSLILTHNLFGAEIDGRAGSLAAFALTMKAAARRKLFLKNPVEPNICVLDPIRFSPDELDYLVTRDGDREAEQAFWNQFEHADTFGSLIQADLALTERLSAHLETLDGGGDLYKADPIMWARQVIRQAEILLPGYAVVVANPPYMGSANMEALTTEWVASQYPAEKQDLYACFVRRALQLGTKSGVVALITGDSWMALKTFAQFRNELLTGLTFANFIHLDDVSKHADIFGANTAYVCTLSAPNNATCLCVELEPLSSEAKDELLRDAINRQDAPWTYQVQPSLFRSIPGSPFAYRLSLTDIAAFETGVSLSDIVSFHEGINTGDNDRFLRRWWEVSFDRVSLVTSPGERPRTTWVPHKKGGSYRKWAGNQEYVLNWSNDGEEIRSFARSTTRNTQYFFRASLSWGRISSGDFSIRSYPTGYSFDSTGPCVFGAEGALAFTLGYLNSDLAKHFLRTLSSSLDYRLGNLGNMPAPADYSQFVDSHIERLIDLAQRDWDASELSWGFASDSLVDQQDFRVSDSFASVIASRERLVSEVARLEEDNERRVRSLFSFPATGVARDNSRVALRANPEFQFAPGAQFTDLRVRDAAISDLISYAVGCMFGRYSLDEPGLILADQASTVQDYFAKVPEPTFAPDEDNVIPIVDGDWFDDDIVARFREFLRVAFGEEHFEENLRFVEESLGVKTVRDYFITGKGKSKFYDDHVKRFKKRPIYWLFSSPKGSFNALIYLHRYTPATVGAVLTYLREYITKIDSAREQAERAANAKEADRLRTVLLELRDYERTVYELASEQIAIDLDDGVRVNYPKFYPALKKIPGLEAAE
jgi:hypothetical protein